MPNPTHGSQHVNGLLTNMSVAFIQEMNKYAVGRRVFPAQGVQKQTDAIARYNRNDFFRSEVQRRQAGAKPHRSGFRVSSTETYRTDVWSLAKPVADEERANADSPFMPERDTVRYLTQQMLIRQDVEWTSNFFSTGDIWTGSSDSADLVAGTDFTAWSNAASNPVEDIATQQENVESNTGFLPNKLVVNRKVFNDLKNHADIENRISGSANRDAPAVANERTLAEILGVDEVVVTASVQSTEPEGSTSTSASYIAGDHALLAHTPSQPSLYMPAAGFTFLWNGLNEGQANLGQSIRTLREEESRSDLVVIEAAWDQKIVESDLGVLFANASTR